MRNVSHLHSQQQEAGMSIRDLSRVHGVSEPTIYNWKAKYGGMYAGEQAANTKSKFFLS
jgi:transposase